MVSALDSGFEPWQGHCVVFLGNTLSVTLTVPLFTQEYKWIPVSCQENLTKCLGVTDGLASRPGEVAILLASGFILQKPG